MLLFCETLALAYSAIMEKSLLRDLVYIFQGINGNTIKIVKGDSYEICSNVSVSSNIANKDIHLRIR
jgi:hypothetical protein